MPFLNTEWGKEDDFVEINSISLKKWCVGRVRKVIEGESQDLLEIEYYHNGCKRSKQVRKASKNIKPLSNPAVFKNNWPPRSVSSISKDEWELKYKLGSFIAKGGEGAIYDTIYVKNKSNTTDIVTKVYNYATEKHCQRILNNHRIFKQCNIIHYNDIAIDKHDKILYVTMEKLNKSTPHPMFTLKIKYLIVEILSQLYRIHQRGYVHSDVNPWNIMQRKTSKQWCLIDPMMLPIGQSAECVGKYGYIAPEIINTDKKIKETTKYTPANDIFSLGLTMLFILTCGKSTLYPSDMQMKQTQMQSKFDFHRIYCNYIHKKGRNEIDNIIKGLKNKYILRKPPRLFDIISNMSSFDPLKRSSIIDIITDDYFSDIIKVINVDNYKQINIKKRNTANQWNVLIPKIYESDNKNIL